MKETDADERLASWLAESAGTVLLDLHAEVSHQQLEPSEVGRLADRQAHDFLCAALRRVRPDDSILSEEGSAGPDRAGAHRVWIIDPLDGTREFSEQERDDWAVHVALAVDGEVTAAAVALPARSLVLSSARGVAETPPFHRPPRILVSRTRPAPEAERMCTYVGGTLVPMGSSGVKAVSVIRGEAEIYLHSGGQWEWDLAAPAAIAKATGLHVSRLDGSPLRFNQPCPWLPDVLICWPQFAEIVLEALALEHAPPDPGRAERALQRAARGRTFDEWSR